MGNRKLEQCSKCRKSPCPLYKGEDYTARRYPLLIIEKQFSRTDNRVLCLSGQDYMLPTLQPWHGLHYLHTSHPHPHSKLVRRPKVAKRYQSSSQKASILFQAPMQTAQQYLHATQLYSLNLQKVRMLISPAASAPSRSNLARLQGSKLEFCLILLRLRLRLFLCLPLPLPPQHWRKH